MRTPGGRFGDLPRCFDAIEERHRDVENRDVGGVLLSQSDGLASVARLGDHLPVRAFLQHLAQALADQRVVISQENPKGHAYDCLPVAFHFVRRRRRKTGATPRHATPPLAQFSMAKEPPNACARSRIPMMPRPRRPRAVPLTRRP